MAKEEYISILKELDITFNEGIQKDIKYENVYPRIVFWEIAWEDISSSGINYETKVTYQTSFFSRIPRDPKLLQLKRILNSKGIGLLVEHEYIQDERYHHSYFPIEVVENINGLSSI